MIPRVNAHVHYTLTRRWAREVGFDANQAEEIARWDVGTDRVFSGKRREYLAYHWQAKGADDLARAYFARAVAERDVRYLGVALHCAQDSVAHGRLNRLLHWPGIDIWQRRRARVRTRLEQDSKELLRAYAFAVRDDEAPGGEAGEAARAASASESVPELPDMQDPREIPPM